MHTWTYEYSLYTHCGDNFKSILRGFVAIAIVMWVLMSCLLSCGAHDAMSTFWGATKIFLLSLPCIVVISFLGAMFVAFINGGSYTALFQMNEQGVKQLQVESKNDRQEKVVDAAIVLRMLTLGHGARTPFIHQLRAKSRLTCTTKWADVRQIIPMRHKHLIYLKERIGHSKVYVADADFDFVLSFIQSKCTKLSH